MIFPVLAFITVFTSAILWLFGFMSPNGSIWDLFFSSNSMLDIFKNVLSALWNSVDIFGNLFGALTTIISVGLVAGGIYSGRDEPLYGGFGVLVFQMLGLYSIFSASVPVDLKPLVIALMGIYNFLFVLAFINWIRGKGE